MKVHYDLLSKQPRAEWVSILVEETNDESDTVRVRLREMPEAEFSIWEASFQGAVSALGRLTRDMSQLENKIHQERAQHGHASQANLSTQQTLVKAIREAKADLDQVRREIVGRCVIDHRPEDFEIDHLPFVGDAIAPEAQAALLALGFSEAQILQGFQAGFVQMPFTPGSWVYGEGATAKANPGASEETVRFYERIHPGGVLLHSLCNAVIYWHRMALLSAEQRKVAIKEARQKRQKTEAKVGLLLKSNLVKAERIGDLLELPARSFELAVQLILEAIELRMKMAEQKAPPENPLQG